ncbi:MAG: hypothetical protein ACK51M_09040 [Burkholderiales bacterium]
MLAGVLASGPAGAIDDRADLVPNERPAPGRDWAWRATLGRYHQNVDPSGLDLNLRASDEDDTAWVGLYRDDSGEPQLRAGWERQGRVGPVRLLGSLQLASGGFVGGSLTAEAWLDAAERVALLVGLGRTNLRPYVNLNFDPNDSTLLGLRGRLDAATDATLFEVRDDRLGTGQRVAHLVLRRRFDAATAGSIDLFRRSGRAAPGAPLVSGTGVALTWSHADWFVRVAYDPNVSYGESDMVRLSVGLRF